MGISRRRPRGRKPASLSTRDARLEAIEASLVLGAWSLRRARELASQYEVDPRQVRRDCASVRASWRERLPRDAEEARAVMVAKLAAAQSLALRDGKLEAHVRQLRLEAEVTGALSPVQVEVAVVRAESQADDEEVARRIVAAYPRACALLGVSPSAPTAIETDQHKVEIVDEERVDVEA